MEEKDFEKILNIEEIKSEYEEIKNIDEMYFMIVKESFSKVKILEKYLQKKICKSVISVKVNNINRKLNNLPDLQLCKLYSKLYFSTNYELLNIMDMLKVILKFKKNRENLQELKDYYLSMRFLTYYYKLIMHNYNIRLIELDNLSRGIVSIMPSDSDNIENSQAILKKIRERYEVSHGKNK